MVPGIVTVTVKNPVGQQAANLMHPTRARALIRAGATAAIGAALRGQAGPALRLEGPVDLELRFARSVQAEAAAILPGAERSAANAVTWQGSDYLACFRAFRAMIALASWT
jgi:D-amino peptidase